MATEPKTGLTFWPSGAIQQDLLFNALLLHMAASGYRASVVDKDLTAPPAHVAGNAYIIAATATGLWDGKEGQIAYSDGVSWTYFVPAEGYSVAVLDEDLDYRFTGSSWTAGGSAAVSSVNGDTGAVVVPVPIIIACSDETTALTTGAAKVTFRMPFAMTLTAVRASAAAAPTGSVLTVDINEGGSSILSTKLTIDANEKTSTTAATPAVISDAALADDAEITIDIDAVGGTYAGAGLKVALIGYPL